MDRDFSRTPWEPEPIDESTLPGRGWKRTLLVLGLAFVIGPLVLFGARLFLTHSISGTVTFSSLASDCASNRGVDTFTAGVPVYATVVLERGVSPGEVFTVRLLRGDDVLSSAEFTVESAGNCSSDLVDRGTLPAGNYRVTYSAGDELLAEGTFEVT